MPRPRRPPRTYPLLIRASTKRRFTCRSTLISVIQSILDPKFLKYHSLRCFHKLGTELSQPMILRRMRNGCDVYRIESLAFLSNISLLKTSRFAFRVWDQSYTCHQSNLSLPKSSTVHSRDTSTSRLFCFWHESLSAARHETTNFPIPAFSCIALGVYKYTSGSGPGYLPYFLSYAWSDKFAFPKIMSSNVVTPPLSQGFGYGIILGLGYFFWNQSGLWLTLS